MILQFFSEWKKRDEALLQRGSTSSIRPYWPAQREARHSFDDELEILVVGFPLAAPCQTLAGQQEGIHVISQVRQWRQSSRHRVSELADVITSSDTVLGTHRVDYFARREHVQLQVREARLAVFFADAGQYGSVQGTAGHAVVRMPCSLHFE